MNYELKDSGKREEFETGSLRDTREGKGRFDLISPYAERRLALVLEKGAVKYGERNWELGQQLGRYLDSALRHINCVKLGLHDEDHAAQAMWNLHSLIHTAEMIQEGRLPRSLDDLAYVPFAAAIDVADEPGRPEQAKECCRESGCAGPCDSVSCDRHTRPAELEASATSSSDVTEPGDGAPAPWWPGVPALWWRIREYLKSNGPQESDHMWFMLEWWGCEGGYREGVEARTRAGVELIGWHDVVYWRLPEQLCPAAKPIR